jgi:hypothetical protein
MASDKLRKGADEQVLEGGLGGAGGGGRSATAKRVQSMTPEERAALENPGKQFEMSSEQKADLMERIRKSKERIAALPPQEREMIENIGKQFEAKKKGGVVSASKRADGICQRGKTRGRVI